MSTAEWAIEAYEVRRELPAGPGSKDAAKLDSQIWLRINDRPPELAAHGPAFVPKAVALRAGGVLVVFQLGGLHMPPRPPAAHSWTAEEPYLKAREGSGASIGWAFRHADGRWQRGYVARAQEILVRDRMEQDAFSERIYPIFEHLGPPALEMAGDEVPWCTWANPQRRHIYRVRWLGPAGGKRGCSSERVG